MDKKYLIENNIYFRIENSEESEYIQKYLFELGFVWFQYDGFEYVFMSYKKIIPFSIYPVLLFTNYNLKYKYHITTTKQNLNAKHQIHTGRCVTYNKLIRKQKLKSLEKLNAARKFFQF